LEQLFLIKLKKALWIRFREEVRSLKYEERGKKFELGFRN